MSDFLKNTDLPYFVSGGLRLTLDGKQYYRDGGQWGLDFGRNRVNGQIQCTGGYNMQHMVGKFLTPITYEEYLESNGEYADSIRSLVNMGYDETKIRNCGKSSSLSNRRKYLLIG